MEISLFHDPILGLWTYLSWLFRALKNNKAFKNITSHSAKSLLAKEDKTQPCPSCTSWRVRDK